MRLMLIAVALLCSMSSFASVAPNPSKDQFAYYGDLFWSRFPEIDRTHLFLIFAKNRQTPVSYTRAREILFGNLDVKKDGNRDYVIDVYCEKKFSFNSVGEIAARHTEVNIEHTWPQSKFSRRYSKDLQKADLHHLYLTDSLANNDRGNLPFGNVEDSEDELRVTNCSSSQLAHGTFEPPKAHVGNVARSLFYFAVRYELPIDQAQEKVLREWHRQDPVDAAERARHDKIAHIQNSRNPFVEFPELVDAIHDF